MSNPSATSLPRRPGLRSLVIGWMAGMALLAGCAAPGRHPGGIRADGSMVPFVVTAKYDPERDELPVPEGTTREDYYGRGPTILHGPGKEWRIERPYVFKLVRQEGCRLVFRFRHQERISHAFLGERLVNGVFEPRNAGYAVLDDGEWKDVHMISCWTGPEAILLHPNHDYIIVVSHPFVSRGPPATVRLKVRIHAGCWLEFWSEPFEVKLPHEDRNPDGSAPPAAEADQAGGDGSAGPTPGEVGPAAAAAGSATLVATQ